MFKHIQIRSNYCTELKKILINRKCTSELKIRQNYNFGCQNANPQHVYQRFAFWLPKIKMQIHNTCIKDFA